MIKALLFDFNQVLWFPMDERVNTQLLDALHRLKKDRPIYLLTNSNPYEIPHALSAIQRVVTRIFLAVQLGLPKHKTSTYHRVAEKVGLQPNEILFVDDNKRNARTAKEAGMFSIVYKNNEQLLQYMGRMLA